MEDHITALKEATTDWLSWEDAQINEAKKAEWLGEHNDTAPEQPEPLAILRRLRRFNFSVMMYSGGYLNQPHILMRELNTVMDAELEYDEFKLANLRLTELMKQKEAEDAAKL